MSQPKIDPEAGCTIPTSGQWPVDPQEDQEIEESRLWIDGCFDFFHHGHAGVMLQSRRLGDELLVGLHSDEDIAANKGPTVMDLEERTAAVEACRFSTKVVPHAPYVTSIPWISHYGCQYVTHGDDITSDASGEDCYRFVKKAGRMKIVPRTPGISTTDLVGRMLLCTKAHFIRNFTAALDGVEGRGSEAERKATGAEMRKRITEYAAAPNGRDPYVEVYAFHPKHRPKERRRSSVASRSSFTSATSSTISPTNSHADSEPQPSNSSARRQSHHDPGKGTFDNLVPGLAPQPDQRIIYVDGGFDLFSSGHIAFLESVTTVERKLADSNGWSSPSARDKRIKDTGHDYPPAYVIAGVHDDFIINHYRGLNYPIMNLYERGLCVVQCKYIHCVIFSAPLAPTRHLLAHLPPCVCVSRPVAAVYHGPTTFLPSPEDPLADAKALGVFVQVREHRFADVNSAQIVRRILDRRTEYEARQKKKGEKAVGEEAARRDEMEKEAEKERARERERRWSEIERGFGA